MASDMHMMCGRIRSSLRRPLPLFSQIILRFGVCESVVVSFVVFFGLKISRAAVSLELLRTWDVGPAVREGELDERRFTPPNIEARPSASAEHGAGATLEVAR